MSRFFTWLCELFASRELTPAAPREPALEERLRQDTDALLELWIVSPPAMNYLDYQPTSLTLVSGPIHLWRYDAAPRSVEVQIKDLQSAGSILYTYTTGPGSPAWRFCEAWIEMHRVERLSRALDAVQAQLHPRAVEEE